jgi:hypothetical protein
MLQGWNSEFKKFPEIFLRWNIPMGRRQNVKPRWRATGFSPQEIIWICPEICTFNMGASVKN